MPDCCHIGARLYICEECVLTAYEDALGRIAKIESSKKKKKSETNDPNSDQPGLEENLDGNESKKEAPIETQGGNDSDGHKNGSPVNGDVDQSKAKSEIVCRYYAAGKCQHGRVRSDCRYSHPRWQKM